MTIIKRILSYIVRSYLYNIIIVFFFEKCKITKNYLIYIYIYVKRNYTFEDLVIM